MHLTGEFHWAYWLFTWSDTVINDHIKQYYLVWFAFALAFGQFVVWNRNKSSKRDHKSCLRKFTNKINGTVILKVDFQRKPCRNSNKIQRTHLFSIDRNVCLSTRQHTWMIYTILLPYKCQKFKASNCVFSLVFVRLNQLCRTKRNISKHLVDWMEVKLNKYLLQEKTKLTTSDAHTIIHLI